MAGDGGACDVSISLRLAAREAVLKRDAKLISWLVYLSVVFEVFASYTVIIIPFLVNEYAYVAILGFLVGVRFLHEVNLFKYVRRPALLLVGPHKSFFFHVNGRVTTSMSPSQWALYSSFVALTLILVLASTIYWSSHAFGPICDHDQMGGVQSGIEYYLKGANDKASRNALHECQLDSRCYTPPARLAALEDVFRDNAELLSLEALKCEFAAMECNCNSGGGTARQDMHTWLHSSVCGFILPCEETWADVMYHAGCKLLVPLLCLLAAPLLFASRVWLKDRRPNKMWLSSQAEAEEAALRSALSSGAMPSSCLSKAKLVAEIVLVVLDMSLDALNIYTLARTEQYFLAILLGAVVLAALAQQLRAGAGTLVIAVTESFHNGHRANILLQALQAEKMQESFWSVFIQAVALPNLLNLDVGTALQLSASILSSMLGISGALYAQVHLCCDHSLSHGESNDLRSRVYGRQRDTE